MDCRHDFGVFNINDIEDKIRMMLDLTNKKVVIIGAARSGVAAANLVIKLGGIAKISDQRKKESLVSVLADLVDSEIQIETDGHTCEFVCDSDLVVVSPGVWKNAQALRWVREKGIPVWAEIELAARCTDKPIIAVTGSNGKTTTATLIAEILKANQKRVCLCGNIGEPFSKYVFEKVDYFVVEVSSFQLELIEDFHPVIAVWLNFLQNHLDRHADMDEYFEAKKRIFFNQEPGDYAVLNVQEKCSVDMEKDIKASVRFFGVDAIDANPNEQAVRVVGHILNVSEDLMNEVFSSFSGVEHRMEYVREMDGVKYINDSKSTTVEATAWALARLDQPVIMIAGGRDKNLDYTVLQDLVQSKVKKMIVYGELRSKFQMIYEGSVSCESKETLEDAVKAASSLAKPGDVILLSPMAASFDQFDNFEHRGQVFKKIVNSL